MSSKMKMVFLSALLLISTVMALTGYAVDVFAADKPIKWRMQDLWGPETVYHKANLKLADRIRQLSNGRLDIKMFPSGSIVKPSGTFDAIRKGAFQGHITAPVYWAGKMPVATILFGVPCGIDNVLDFNVWFWERGGLEIAREAYKAFNLYCVGGGIIEANAMFIKGTKHIESLEDLRGLKIRTLPGLQSKILEAIGATPVFLPMTEVYTAVETGVADGVCGYTIVGWHDMGIHEITKYIVTPGFLQPASNLDVVVNLDAWNKLPADLQAIFECAVQEWNQYWCYGDHQENVKALSNMRNKGLELIELSATEMEKTRNLAIPIIDEYVEKNALAKKAWESQKEYLRFLGKLK